MQYYYSGNWQVLSEYDDSEVLQRSFVYGNYIDEVLLMTDAGGNNHYYVHDHLYSPVALLDGNIYKPITLSNGPLELLEQWHRMVNNLSTFDETISAKIEKSIERGSPLSEDGWIVKTASQLNLESTIRPRGRPRKES